jgi:4-hydroxy-3-methylbut-2-enyl diphosphate reductase
MPLKIAKTAGFCFGVKNAVETARKFIGSDKKIFTLGPIIHNETVTRDLENSGIVAINSPKDAPNGCSVIVRAHGISKKIFHELSAKNIEIINATCPFVKKIQKIVEKELAAGKKIVIIGDKFHPEVIGINGWCEDSAVIIENSAELSEEFFKNLALSGNGKNVCVVCQTTFRRKLYNEIIERLKERLPEITLYDTICASTCERVAESAELAKECDIFFVLGGEKSSNTQKLYESCLENCPKTYKISEFAQLKKYKSLIKLTTHIGVTAGASTPPESIREAMLYMSLEFAAKQTEENARLAEDVITTARQTLETARAARELAESAADVSDADFLAAIEKAPEPFLAGSIVRGVVREFTQSEIVVDLDGKSDGIIRLSEFDGEDTSSLRERFAPGREIEAIVTRVNDIEGYVGLSLRNLERARELSDIERDFKDKRTLTGRVSEIVKGGVVTSTRGGHRVFIPASQVDTKYVEDLGYLLNTEVRYKIIDVTEKRGTIKIVGSIREVLNEGKNEKSEKFWESVELGRTYRGTIKSLTDFGAFIDIGVDALLHISEISWKKISHPSEVFSVGEEVDVRVKSLDREKRKVSLTYKDETENPWNNLRPGDRLSGRISGITDFGVFVDVGGVDGLVHISELSWEKVAHPSDLVKLGDPIDVYVKEIDKERGKISLGYKKLEDNPWNKIESLVKVGDIVKCKIVRILPFGAFAEIFPRVDGLIHVSQISREHVEKPSDVVSVGDEVTARVLAIDLTEKQISLSMKDVLNDDAGEYSFSGAGDASFKLGDLFE